MILVLSFKLIFKFIKQFFKAVVCTDFLNFYYLFNYKESFLYPNQWRRVVFFLGGAEKKSELKVIDLPLLELSLLELLLLELSSARVASARVASA